MFWETRQPSNRPARCCSDCGQRTGVARPLIPDAVPHPCDSCRKKPVLRRCEECLTGCTAYCLEKSRLDLVLSASFSRSLSDIAMRAPWSWRRIPCLLVCGSIGTPAPSWLSAPPCPAPAQRP